MVARRTTNLGLTGIPLFIALELMAYGRGEQKHEEKMCHLAKAYGWIRAYLPVHYETKEAELDALRIPVLKDGNPGKISIRDVLNETAGQIDAMYEAYDPTFEGSKTCSGSEKEYIITMRGVFERITLMCTYSGIIDKMRLPEEVEF